MTMFLPNFMRVKGMRDMIGTKDTRGMIEDLKEQTDTREVIGKVGVIRTSTNEGIEIESTGREIVTEKEMEARIDTETATWVLSLTPVPSLLPQQTTLIATHKVPTSPAIVSKPSLRQRIYDPSSGQSLCASRWALSFVISLPSQSWKFKLCRFSCSFGCAERGTIWGSACACACGLQYGCVWVWVWVPAARLSSL